MTWDEVVAALTAATAERDRAVAEAALLREALVRYTTTPLGPMVPKDQQAVWDLWAPAWEQGQAALFSTPLAAAAARVIECAEEAVAVNALGELRNAVDALRAARGGTR